MSLIFPFKSFNIFWSNKAIKQFDKISITQQENIAKKVRMLSECPETLDLKNNSIITNSI